MNDWADHVRAKFEESTGSMDPASKLLFYDTFRLLADVICEQRPAQSELLAEGIDANMASLMALLALGAIHLSAGPKASKHLILQERASVEQFLKSTRAELLASAFGLHLCYGFESQPAKKFVRHIKKVIKGKNNILLWDAESLLDFELRVNRRWRLKTLVWSPSHVVVVLNSPNAWNFMFLNHPSMQKINRPRFAQQNKPRTAVFECLESAAFFLRTGLIAPWQEISDFKNRHLGNERIQELAQAYENIPETNDIPFLEKL